MTAKSKAKPKSKPSPKRGAAKPARAQAKPAPAPEAKPAEPMATPVLLPPAESPLCHIEFFKNGNIFVARSSVSGKPSREYKNHVLEDMLTELVVDLQEEISE